MSNILLATVGSTGDMYPIIGLGAALRERGHQVALITNGYFEKPIRDANLDFVQIGTAEQFVSETKYRDFSDTTPHQSVKTLVTRFVVPFVEEMYEAIRERYVPGKTILVGSSLAMGARIAHEKLGVPFATVVLYPIVMRSIYESPVVPNWIPKPVKRLVARLVDVAIDRHMAPPVNRFRSSLGLTPTKRLLYKWWFSPQRVICLFPEWFAAEQPDWPPDTRQTGFPLFDERDSVAIPSEAEHFLSSGIPPVVFVVPSWMQQADQFFKASVDACQLAGQRGVLLTRFPSQIPTYLPNEVRHFAYLPHSWLLPRSAALVHHGGIGTLAQALVAGIPQLVVPRSFDQPDNAARLKRMGVGRMLGLRSYRPKNVARVLGEMLTDAKMAERCRELSQSCRKNDWLNETCRLIEDLH